MSLLGRKIALLKTLHRIGWRRVLLVAQHRRRMRSGHYERTCPLGEWPTVEPGRSPFRAYSATVDLAAADRIVGGGLRYFSWKWMPKPATWRENPSNNYVTSSVHWSNLRDFDERQGDVKWIWEPSRFDWAVTLARAFASSGEERYRVRFYELFEDWWRNNPPNQGINWFCAQECSLRMLALIFAAGAFADPRPSAPCPSDIWSTVAALAERVEPSLGYAIGQHNNHGISEAMGLYLGGICLPDHPSAERWREKGKALLCRLIPEQFAPDGSYVQHSFIYQRLAMRCCLACFHAARAFGDSFPKEVEERVLQSARFLYEMMVDRSPFPFQGKACEAQPNWDGVIRQISESPHLSTPDGAGPPLQGEEVAPTGAGRLPNYGANDGANALCLSDCDYLDFRPVIQLAFAVLSGQRAFGEGPWDEELGWYGIDVSDLENYCPPLASEFGATDAGYYVLRSDPGLDADATRSATYAFMRVPRYTDGRPSQADALHVDVWIDGEPVAVDSGTYSYNDPDGWWKHFKTTAAHNTVMVDGLDQMPSAGRFLFTDWTDAQAQILDRAVIGAAVLGDEGASRCKRCVRVEPGLAYITDRIVGSADNKFELRWHLKGEWTLTPTGATNGDVSIEVTSNVELMRHIERDTSPISNHSPAYGLLEPITVYVAQSQDSGTVAFNTLILKGSGLDSPLVVEAMRDKLRSRF